MSTSWVLRVGTISDRASLIRLINDAYRRETNAYYTRPRMTEEALDELFAQGEFLVAEQGTLQGCLHLRIEHGSCHGSVLAVTPDSRGGLAFALLEAGEAWAIRQGCEAMEGTVVSHRRDLLPFYQAMGYEVVGELPFPYPETAKVPVWLIRIRKRFAGVRNTVGEKDSP